LHRETRRLHSIGFHPRFRARQAIAGVEAARVPQSAGMGTPQDRPSVLDPGPVRHSSKKPTLTITAKACLGPPDEFLVNVSQRPGDANARNMRDHRANSRCIREFARS
jgi:hypothetical protein